MTLQRNAREGVRGLRVAGLQRGGLGGVACAPLGIEGVGEGGLVIRVVGRVYAHHHAGIGVALSARILAHAVGDHPAGLAGGGYYRAARAHAKAVHRASLARAVFCVVHQLVVGSPQKRMTGVAPPAGAIDHALRMLNPEPHRKRLGLHRHAALKQHGKGVARAVAQRNHHMAGGQFVAAAIGKVFDLQRPYRLRGLL